MLIVEMFPVFGNAKDGANREQNKSAWELHTIFIS